MDATAIIDVLSRALPATPRGSRSWPSRDGMPTIYVAAEHLVETCRALRDDPELRFVFLADITAVDYLPREPRFEVIYLLVVPGREPASATTPKRLRVKVRVPATTRTCRRCRASGRRRTGPSARSTICSGSTSTAIPTCAGS